MILMVFPFSIVYIYIFFLESKTLKCITNLEVMVTSGDEFIFHITARRKKKFKNHTLVKAFPSS